MPPAYLTTTRTRVRKITVVWPTVGSERVVRVMGRSTPQIRRGLTISEQKANASQKSARAGFSRRRDALRFFLDAAAAAAGRSVAGPAAAATASGVFQATTRNADAGPVRRAVWVPWLLLLALLWAGQLWWLSTTATSWGGYWRWRGVYRPGIWAAQSAAGEYLPGRTFSPLSPSGAVHAFALSSGVYALCVTAALWLVWRLARGTRTSTRRRPSRRASRAATRPPARRRRRRQTA